jgi:hypothetical protein
MRLTGCYVTGGHRRFYDPSFSVTASGVPVLVPDFGEQRASYAQHAQGKTLGVAAILDLVAARWPLAAGGLPFAYEPLSSTRSRAHGRF